VFVYDDNTNSYQLIGLDNWTEYTVQLAAVNEVGISEYTTVLKCRTRESGELNFVYSVEYKYSYQTGARKNGLESSFMRSPEDTLDVTWCSQT
jgi:hypothetical protein